MCFTEASPSSCACAPHVVGTYCDACELGFWGWNASAPVPYPGLNGPTDTSPGCRGSCWAIIPYEDIYSDEDVYIDTGSTQWDPDNSTGRFNLTESCAAGFAKVPLASIAEIISRCGLRYALDEDTWDGITRSCAVTPFDGETRSVADVCNLSPYRNITFDLRVIYTARRLLPSVQFGCPAEWVAPSLTTLAAAWRNASCDMTLIRAGAPLKFGSYASNGMMTSPNCSNTGIDMSAYTANSNPSCKYFHGSKVLGWSTPADYRLCPALCDPALFYSDSVDVFGYGVGGGFPGHSKLETQFTPASWLGCFSSIPPSSATTLPWIPRWHDCDEYRFWADRSLTNYDQVLSLGISKALSLVPASAAPPPVPSLSDILARIATVHRLVVAGGWHNFSAALGMHFVGSTSDVTNPNGTYHAVVNVTSYTNGLFLRNGISPSSVLGCPVELTYRGFTSRLRDHPCNESAFIATNPYQLPPGQYTLNRSSTFNTHEINAGQRLIGRVCGGPHRAKVCSPGDFACVVKYAGQLLDGEYYNCDDKVGCACADHSFLDPSTNCVHCLPGYIFSDNPAYTICRRIDECFSGVNNSLVCGGVGTCREVATLLINGTRVDGIMSPFSHPPNKIPFPNEGNYTGFEFACTCPVGWAGHKCEVNATVGCTANVPSLILRKDIITPYDGCGPANLVFTPASRSGSNYCSGRGTCVVRGVSTIADKGATSLTLGCRCPSGVTGDRCQFPAGYPTAASGSNVASITSYSNGNTVCDAWAPRWASGSSRPTLSTPCSGHGTCQLNDMATGRTTIPYAHPYYDYSLGGFKGADTSWLLQQSCACANGWYGPTCGSSDPLDISGRVHYSFTGRPGGSLHELFMIPRSPALSSGFRLTGFDNWVYTGFFDFSDSRALAEGEVRFDDPSGAPVFVGRLSNVHLRTNATNYGSLDPSTWTGTVDRVSFMRGFMRYSATTLSHGDSLGIATHANFARTSTYVETRVAHDNVPTDAQRCTFPASDPDEACNTTLWEPYITCLGFQIWPEVNGPCNKAAIDRLVAQVTTKSVFNGVIRVASLEAWGGDSEIPAWTANGVDGSIEEVLGGGGKCSNCSIVALNSRLVRFVDVSADGLTWPMLVGLGAIQVGIASVFVGAFVGAFIGAFVGAFVGALSAFVGAHSLVLTILLTAADIVPVVPKLPAAAPTHRYLRWLDVQAPDSPPSRLLL